MEKGSGGQHGLSRREREKQEAKIKVKRRTRRNRFIGAAVGSAVLLSATAAGVYSVAGPDSSRGTSAEATRTSDLSLLPLPELRGEDVTSQALLAASEYTRLTGVPVDGERLKESISFAPNYSKMDSQEKEKFCGRGLEIKCREASAITKDADNIFFYKDGIDALFLNPRNTELARNHRNEAILWVLLHETSHWIGDTHTTTPSDELYQLVVKYFGEKSPFIKESKYVKGDISGAVISGKDTTSTGFFGVFNGVDEAEAENNARYILQNRGAKTYANFENPNDMYVLEQRKMLEDLYKKLNPDYGASIRWVAQMRVQQGGREEIFKTVGKRFGASESSALELGFRIYFAIDRGDFTTYRELTSGK